MSNKSKLRTWLIIFIVIVAIVVLVLTIGALSPDTKEEEEKRKQREAEEERLRELERQAQLVTLQSELVTINVKLARIRIQFDEIKVQEKWLLFTCRIIIGAIILGLDYWYYKNFGVATNVSETISEMLKFNSALIGGYSFLAFVSHGTPAKFANYLKSKIKSILRFWHRKKYIEYELLIESIALITEIIKGLEAPVKLKVDLEKNKN